MIIILWYIKRLIILIYRRKYLISEETDGCFRKILEKEERKYFHYILYLGNEWIVSRIMQSQNVVSLVLLCSVVIVQITVVRKQSIIAKSEFNIICDVQSLLTCRYSIRQ